MKPAMGGESCVFHRDSFVKAKLAAEFISHPGGGTGLIINLMEEPI